MQVFGLSGHRTRGASLVSRLCAAERPGAVAKGCERSERTEAVHRREDALLRWQPARSQGVTVAAAADVVGVPRAMLSFRLCKAENA